MKNIFITGARSGIIASVIDRIKNNYNLYLGVHTDKECEVLKEKYKDYDNIFPIKFDISSDVENIDNYKIDILVLNAAAIYGGSLIDMPFDNIRDNMEINYFSNLRIIKKVINSNEKVKIIVMSSLASKMPLPFLGAYASSKAALTSMIRSLGFEVKMISKKVTLCVIEPGLYKTGFNKYGFDSKYDFMDNNSFFKYHIDLIRKSENIFLNLFEKRKYDSICKKIVKAIISENPKFYYRSPFSQVLFVKLYNFFA